MSSKIEVPAYIYYTGDNVDKATANPHYVSIQRELTERALALIEIDDSFPQMILDVGCGTAISGQLISETMHHMFVGVDIAPEMLLNAIKVVPPSKTPNSFVRADVGLGCPFRAGVFDAAIGIDVLRWLFVSFEGDEPVVKRLKYFFESLHGCLRNGAKAIFNFHPEQSEQAELLNQIAVRCGFGGGIHTEFPNSTKKKVHWLILEVGGVSPDFIEDKFTPTSAQCINVDSFKSYDNHKKKGFNRKEFIKKKKERRRLLGKKTANDSKYSGRSRRRWI